MRILDNPAITYEALDNLTIDDFDLCESSVLHSALTVKEKGLPITRKNVLAQWVTDLTRENGVLFRSIHEEHMTFVDAVDMFYMIIYPLLDMPLFEPSRR